MRKFLELRELADKIAKNFEVIDENFINIFSQIHNAIYENLGRNYLLEEEIIEMYNVLECYNQEKRGN